MIRFNNDYNKSACKEILKRLCETEDNAYAGYGLDEICTSAKEKIRHAINNHNADVHFLVGGTQTNAILIASCLKPWESPVCADAGHINVHETGAIENTGHKVIAIQSENGKIKAGQIEKIASDYESSPVPEHITIPKLVYISQPTEFGTLYSKQEIIDISEICRKHNLYFYVDGARLAYALASPENDATLEDLAEYTDAFYIGGTKCGAMIGEALVITNNTIKPNFRNGIKQNGGMLAKGWIAGLQFDVLFTDNLYVKNASESIDQAYRIKNAFNDKGIKPYIDSPTNQQFFILSEQQKIALEQKYIFEDEGMTENGEFIVRFCTAWSTPEADVNELLKDIAKL